MSTGGIVAAAGTGLTGTVGIIAAALGGSPWPLLAAIAVIGAAVLVVGVVVLTAARADDEDRHRRAHAVLRTLVFADRGALPPVIPTPTDPNPAGPAPEPARPAGHQR